VWDLLLLLLLVLLPLRCFCLLLPLMVLCLLVRQLLRPLLLKVCAPHHHSHQHRRVPMVYLLPASYWSCPAWWSCQRSLLRPHPYPCTSL
jgi:hypothetical protein